jgi:alkylated DNA repair dioxygenase AlkB
MFNLLPNDGAVFHHADFLTRREASGYFSSIRQEIPWQHDKVVMFGKVITTKRQVSWHADHPVTYTYSKIQKTARPWTPHLGQIKQAIERHTGLTFNSCLLNLYASGAEGMGWHSDNEPELEPSGPIASISLGAERKFIFRHKISKQQISLHLEHGSLLLMTGVTQKYWQHTLPRAPKINEPRINLTFRRIISTQ